MSIRILPVKRVSRSVDSHDQVTQGASASKVSRTGRLIESPRFSRTGHFIPAAAEFAQTSPASLRVVLTDQMLPTNRAHV